MEATSPERLQGMINSPAPAVRQRGLQLLAEALRGQNIDPQIAQIARVLAGATFQKSVGGVKPEIVKYSSEAKTLRRNAQNALSGMANAAQIREALGSVLLHDDAKKRQEGNLEG